MAKSVAQKLKERASSATGDFSSSVTAGMNMHERMQEMKKNKPKKAKKKKKVTKK